MQEGFLLVLIALTSAGAWAVGARRLGLDPRALGAAAGRLLESLGVIVIFLAANLLVAGLLILTARSVGPRFVSLYLADDVIVLVLSVLQGLAFQAWRGRARCHPPTAERDGSLYAGATMGRAIPRRVARRSARRPP